MLLKSERLHFSPPVNSSSGLPLGPQAWQCTIRSDEFQQGRLSTVSSPNYFLRTRVALLAGRGKARAGKKPESVAKRQPLSQPVTPSVGSWSAPTRGDPHLPRLSSPQGQTQGYQMPKKHHSSQAMLTKLRCYGELYLGENT